MQNTAQFKVEMNEESLEVANGRVILNRGPMFETIDVITTMRQNTTREIVQSKRVKELKVEFTDNGNIVTTTENSSRNVHVVLTGIMNSSCDN